MTFYKKKIKNIILFLFLYLFTIINFSAESHEIKPSIADFFIKDNILKFNIRLNAELILSGIDASVIDDTNNSNFSSKYDNLRKLPKKDLEKIFINSWDNIRQNIFIKLDSNLLNLNLVSINVTEQNNFEISRDSIVIFQIPLFDNSKYFSFSWAKFFGPIILREQNAKKDDENLYTNYLNSGDKSNSIKIKNLKKINRINSSLKYLILGIEHIIPKGKDHILFIFGIFFF